MIEDETTSHLQNLPAHCTAVSAGLASESLSVAGNEALNHKAQKVFMKAYIFYKERLQQCLVNIRVNISGKSGYAS